MTSLYRSRNGNSLLFKPSVGWNHYSDYTATAQQLPSIMTSTDPITIQEDIAASVAMQKSEILRLKDQQAIEKFSGVASKESCNFSAVWKRVFCTWPRNKAPKEEVLARAKRLLTLDWAIVCEENHTDEVRF